MVLPAPVYVYHFGTGPSNTPSATIVERDEETEDRVPTSKHTRPGIGQLIDVGHTSNSSITLVDVSQPTTPFVPIPLTNPVPVAVVNLHPEILIDFGQIPLAQSVTSQPIGLGQTTAVNAIPAQTINSHNLDLMTISPHLEQGEDQEHEAGWSVVPVRRNNIAELNITGNLRNDQQNSNNVKAGLVADPPRLIHTQYITNQSQVFGPSQSSPAQISHPTNGGRLHENVPLIPHIDEVEPPTEPFVFGRRDDRRQRAQPSVANALPLRLNAQADIINVYASHQKRIKDGAGEGTWLALPEIPSWKELSISQVVVEDIMPVNVTDQSWDDAETYLNTHYRFFREEATRPLREAIAVVCGLDNLQEADGAVRASSQGIGIYEDVRVKKFTLSKRGFGVRVSFSLRAVGKNVKWDQSKRLITGSLVALSPKGPDKFKGRFIVATVAARNIKNLAERPPEVDLFFADAEDIAVHSSVSYVMIEARSGFFEAQRHSLLALQKMSDERFPLSEHLVHSQVEIATPAYVTHQPRYDLTSIFEADGHAIFDRVDIVKDWPTARASTAQTLDDSQQDALRTILSKQLAIIQGPPGTGKTHVSVKALEVMLKNWTDGSPPIVVACQTNHALDQLLRLIGRSIPENLVRLGGRSNDQEGGLIHSRTLYQLKQRMRGGPPGVNQIAFKFRSLEEQLKTLLEPLTAKKGLLNLGLYQKLSLLSEKQCEILEGGDSRRVRAAPSPDDLPLELWLGDDLLDEELPFQLDDRFYEQYDEEELPPELLEELEAETKPKDEDADRLVGGQIDIISGVRGRVNNLTDAEVQKILREKDDLWTIKRAQKSSVFNWLQKQAKSMICHRLRDLVAKWNEACKEWSIKKFETDLTIVRGNMVVGMTTTGLSKYRTLVASLSPKVILIEEAAESLEAPVIAACMDSVEQLILVGDHKQLRPSCVLSESSLHGWDISLFERLVNNGLDYKLLQTQRRMIPEIRRILYPIYEDDVRDHESVKDVVNRPPVPGMGGINSYFFTHEWPSQRNEQMSQINRYEADMIVGFAAYLVKNGTPLDRITILTFYNGQRVHILLKLHAFWRVRGMNQYQNQDNSKPIFKVVTVDSYQGEENDIVILSTVRSKEPGQNYSSIGFLALDNRVCVALSRARRGFYVFGNGNDLARESRTWSQVMYILGHFKDVGEKTPIESVAPFGMRRIGYRLPIHCEKHNRFTFLQVPDQWAQNEGGCAGRCEEKLACGHACPSVCHLSDHKDISCEEDCKRLLECGHLCGSKCGDRCICEVCGAVSHEPAPAAIGKWGAFGSLTRTGW